MNLLKNKLLWAFIVIIVPIILIFSFRPTEKMLHISTSNEITNIDPATVFNDDSLRVLGQVYEPLYQYHYLLRPFQIVPLLAEELPQVSDNGKTYTIKIKKNIPYHDHRLFMGKQRFVEAKDFIMAFKRLAFSPLKSPAQSFFKGKILGFEAFQIKVGQDFNKLFTEEIEGLSALDSQTLIIKLEKPIVTMTALLTTTFISPLPEEIIKATQNDLTHEDIGTGPFFISKFDDKKEIILKRFEDYHEDFYPSVGDLYASENQLLKASGKKLPFLNQIKLSFIKDDDERWDRFFKGELDLIEVPKTKMIELNENDTALMERYTKKGIRFEAFPVYSNKWLSFNMRDPIVGKNIELRRAIAHALDIPTYIQEITNNSLQEANSLLTPGIFGYDPKRKPSFSYNPLLAKDFLKKAGYPEGKGLPALTFSTRIDSPASQKTAEFVKASLQKIGVTINIQYLPFEELLQKGRSGALQFWSDSWFYDYPEAENMLQLLVSKNFPGINKTGYKNAEVDALYEKITTVEAPTDALKWISTIEDIAYRDLPWIVYAYERTYFLFKDDVKNFRYTGFIRNYLKYLDRQ